MKQRTSATMAAALLLVAVSSAQERSDVVYPDHPNVVDVTRAPYFAKGDGMTDDSDALQQAINEHTGQGRILYFPLVCKSACHARGKRTAPRYAGPNCPPGGLRSRRKSSRKSQVRVSHL